MKKLLPIFALLLACNHPVSGPDKTVAGAVLGAGWGAGAGAVVGNQTPEMQPGEGAAIGAAFGLVSGALSGASVDSVEPEIIRQEKELKAIQVQNMASAREISKIQDSLDDSAKMASLGGVYQVFFDTDLTNLRSGSITNLEIIAESIKSNSSAYVVNVIGHSDDAGTPDYNKQLAEARARNVASYLQARGISADQILVKSYGATQPIASNNTEAGRQLNRRVDVYISRKG